MRTWKWMTGYVSAIKWTFISSIILEIISMLGAIGIIAIQKFVIDDIFMEKNYELFWPVIGWLFTATIIYFIAHAVAFILMRMNETDLPIAFYRDLIKYYFRMPFSRFAQERVGKMYTYFTSEANITGGFLANRVLIGVVGIFQSIVLIIIVGFSSWPILGIIFCATALYIIMGKYYAPRKKELAKEVHSLQSNVNVLIEEGISSTREVVAFHRTAWESKRMQDMFNKYLVKVMRESKLSNKELFSVEPLKWGVDLGVLGFAGYHVIQGNLSIGMLVVLYQFSSQLMSSLQQTYSFITGSANSFAAAERLMNEVNGSSIENGNKKLKGAVTDLRFECVSFRYNADANEVFNQLSLKFHMGTKIAFVGFSGGGKSTIVQLLARFYEPQDGKIMVNHMDLKEIDRDSWMQRLAIVFQEPYLFTDTVKNNLLLGSENVSEESIIHVCKAAEIYDQIRSFPDGFETMVGERGIQLSAGQRQRIAIARALLREPEILILDEATSALDLETERKLFHHLDRDYPETTKIIIAHRLSTIENADHIFVLDKGKVAEQGTHEQLLKRDSLYKALVAKQNDIEFSSTVANS